MKVSIRTVEQLVEFALPPIDELMSLISMRLGGIEGVTFLGKKYKDARIVRVIECDKHPDADKLSICKIDDNRMVDDIERDDKGLVQVVCGAPNVHAGMWAVWLPPKSTVPSTFDDAEPFVLSARKLRGVMSYGMLAAGDELAINTDHEGIIELTENDLPLEAEIEPGMLFMDMFGLDDVIIEIENKMFTHRPDCFGQLGVAREIAGICGEQFTSAEWYRELQRFDDGTGLPLDTYNDALEKVPRFMAVAIKNVHVTSSPLWLQIELVRFGIKPINSIVDATNYAMLMTAQPTHAYDYDTLRGHKIGVRMATQGETVTLLNDKTYELTPDDIVIVDGEGVIGLGGVMGGLESEVTKSTKNIVLEVANFDMYAIRKTSMRHGLFTDAVTRFNKGQSPRQNAAVMACLLSMIEGEQASDVVDICNDQVTQMSKPQARLENVISITEGFVGARLGIETSFETIKKILGHVEIDTVSGQYGDAERDGIEKVLGVVPPFWRTDLELAEDIVEEVGRLIGFDELPRELPQRSTKAAPKTAIRELKKQLRDSLSRMGANEVLTYSFVHERTLRNAMQDPTRAYRLSNALSPDLQYYRLTVLPSLLDKVHMNIKAGHNEFTLFEIGKGHDKELELNAEHLPQEISYLDMIYASKKPRSGAAYYRVRQMIELLADTFGAKLTFRPLEKDNEDMTTAPFEAARSARVVALLADKEVELGIVGELKQQVIQSFKLPQYAAAATLLIEELRTVVESSRKIYVPLSRFPSTSRDISLKGDKTFTEIDAVVRSVIDGATGAITVHYQLLTIYQPDNKAADKTTTIRLTFTSYDKTLTDKDVAPIVSAIEMAARQAGCEVA